MPRVAKRDWTSVQFTHYRRLDMARRPQNERTLPGGVIMDCDFAVTVDDRTSRYLVHLVVTVCEGRLSARSVRVEMRSDGVRPVAGEVLRSVPVESFVQRSLSMAPADLDLFPARVSARSFRVVGDQDGARRVVEEAASGNLDQLTRVAAVYRAGSTVQPGKETAYVAETLGYSRGHASRLVAQARRVGILGRARPGQSGEVTDD